MWFRFLRVRPTRERPAEAADEHQAEQEPDDAVETAGGRRAAPGGSFHETSGSEPETPPLGDCRLGWGSGRSRRRRHPPWGCRHNGLGLLKSSCHHGGLVLPGQVHLFGVWSLSGSASGHGPGFGAPRRVAQHRRAGGASLRPAALRSRAGPGALGPTSRQRDAQSAPCSDRCRDLRSGRESERGLDPSVGFQPRAARPSLMRLAFVTAQQRTTPCGSVREACLQRIGSSRWK